jgi:dihydroorotase
LNGSNNSRLLALLWKSLIISGAGDGNRTHVASLEGWSSTIELHPRLGIDTNPLKEVVNSNGVIAKPKLTSAARSLKFKLDKVGWPAMNSLLLAGGRVIDPANRVDQTADLLILNGKIAAVEPNAASQAPADLERVDVAGLVVCPGLIDLHVHLREPGQTAKETIATGTAAAARGGFTSVVCMPNTSPTIDNSGTVALIHERAAKQGVVNVFVAGAITKGIAGEELAPIGSLKRAGVVAITDDGHCVQNNEMMRRALEYAKMFDLPVMDHCQDYSLVTDGVMHEGYWSTSLGLRGWPAAGEEMIVARNILLAEMTGARVHCQHISTAGSVKLIREAKRRGVPISGEACPHHFTLTDVAIAGSEKFWQTDGKEISGRGSKGTTWPAYDTDFKMNPPLRSASDREAILEGIVDGTLEIICSDHAPHCDYEKEVEFDGAPFGITGLETELALSLMQLVHSKRLSLPDLIAKFTVAPARLLGLAKGTLGIGADADVTVLDPDHEWVFDKNASASKSGNSPFDGWRLKGKAMVTIVGGRKVWAEEVEVCRT